MERYLTVRNYQISHTDIARFWIIVSLSFMLYPDYGIVA